jgi:pilus assembly protein CpaF
VISDSEVLAALRMLQQEFTGAGPLEDLLRDPATTDVLVTAPDGVWVDRGAGLARAGVAFADEDAVRRLAQRLALTAGRRLDDSSPYVDALLPGGAVRLHAVLSPIAAGGTCVSLRVLRPALHDLSTLRLLGMVDDDGLRLLRAVVRARLAFLIAGGTASGKTTLLSALSPVSRMTSAWCVSRTPRSCARRTRMCCGWSRDRRTSRVPVRWCCAISYARR